jgi:drug/metabolite transporter (DMT)-like permease
MLKSLNKSALEGILYALVAAILFGGSTPFSKLLVNHISPVLLAGLLYLGSGIGLGLWWFIRSRLLSHESSEANLKKPDWPWLLGATVFGGLIAPIFLMWGLSALPASTASLLLNLESVLTASLAFLVFKENVDRRILFGMLTIFIGGLLLSYQGGFEPGSLIGIFCVFAACLGWAIDNNLTRKVSGGNPVQIASIKGLFAGIVNITIALSMGAYFPTIKTSLEAGVIGFLGYGVSLTCFVLALRHVGTARTSAYFSTAPFIGACLSIFIFKEPITPYFLMASSLMGIGVWLHITEHHEHEHTHEAMAHEHKHVHDEHHQHEHGPNDPPGEPHSHWHEHAPMTHKHPHFPDLHHRHEH